VHVDVVDVFHVSGLLKCCVCVSWVSGVKRGGVWVSGFDLMTQIGSSQANIYWEGVAIRNRTELYSCSYCRRTMNVLCSVNGKAL
jgi:hypothetical protein